MNKAKRHLSFLLVFSVILACFFFAAVPAAASSALLKKGMQGNDVTTFQKDLKTLGYFSEEPTGYFGDVTKNSVIRLQKQYGLEADGIAGSKTMSLVDRLMGRRTGTQNTSRSSSGKSSDLLMQWFKGVSKTLARGDAAEIYDIETGLSFSIKRTYGTNHADCETLTLEDTKTMKEIFGGSWSWDRRAVIVTIDGKKIAASMAGMPHAGVDGKPADTRVSSRSGGYGRGKNLDAVKGNGMNGVFDLHFIGSRTHCTNRVDWAHQKMIKEAAAWYKENR